MFLHKPSNRKKLENKNEKTEKEELSHQVAEKDAVIDGLICVFSVVEQNCSFAVHYGE